MLKRVESCWNLIMSRTSVPQHRPAKGTSCTDDMRVNCLIDSCTSGFAFILSRMF